MYLIVTHNKKYSLNYNIDTRSPSTITESFIKQFLPLLDMHSDPLYSIPF